MNCDNKPWVDFLKHVLRPAKSALESTTYRFHWLRVIYLRVFPPGQPSKTMTWCRFCNPAYQHVPTDKKGAFRPVSKFGDFLCARTFLLAIPIIGLLMPLPTDAGFHRHAMTGCVGPEVYMSRLVFVRSKSSRLTRLIYWTKLKYLFVLDIWSASANVDSTCH